MQAQAANEDDDALVVLISGHTQNGGNDNDKDPDNTTSPLQPSLGAGIRKLEPLLEAAKFKNRKLFSEDPGNASDAPWPEALNPTHCGDNLVYIVTVIKNEIRIAKEKGAILKLVLIGYSHGG